MLHVCLAEHEMPDWVSRQLATSGMTASYRQDVYGALAELARVSPAAIIVQLDWLTDDEMEFIHLASRARPEAALFVIAGHRGEDRTADAIRRGARGVLTQPAWLAAFPVGSRAPQPSSGWPQMATEAPASPEKTTDSLASPPDVLDVDLERRLQADLPDSPLAQSGGEESTQAGDGVSGETQLADCSPHSGLNLEDAEIGDVGAEDALASSGSSSVTADEGIEKAGLPAETPVSGPSSSGDADSGESATGVRVPWERNDHDRPMRVPPSAGQEASNGPQTAESSWQGLSDDAVDAPPSPAEFPATGEPVMESEAEDPPLLTPDEVAQFFGKDARGTLLA